MRRLKTSLLVLLGLSSLLAVGAWLIFQLPTFGGRFDGERLTRMRQSKQYVNGRFENTPPYVSNFSWAQEIRSYLGDQIREPQFTVPVLPMSADALRAPPQPDLRSWWLGHASVLVEIDGVRILTDPMLSQRASPFQFIGPARLHPPPLPLTQWPQIDAVVISHDHFDHLHMDTIRHLAQGGTHSAYFSGDTGYAGHFKAIRERLGSPQLAILKVGAYGDTWLDIHMNPEAAIQAQQDLGASTLLPVHWATFNLAYHEWTEPILRTLAAAKAKGVHVVTPRIGERFEYGRSFENTHWFRPATAK